MSTMALAPEGMSMSMRSLPPKPLRRDHEQKLLKLLAVGRQNLIRRDAR